MEFREVVDYVWVGQVGIEFLSKRAILQAGAEIKSNSVVKGPLAGIGRPSGGLCVKHRGRSLFVLASDHDIEDGIFRSVVVGEASYQPGTIGDSFGITVDIKDIARLAL